MLYFKYLFIFFLLKTELYSIPQIIPNIINKRGKKIILKMLVFADIKFITIRMTETNELHIKEAIKGFFLYFNAELNPPDIPPNTTQTTDRMSVKFIGFLNFKESKENANETISIVKKQTIIPIITDKTKLSFLPLLN